MTMGTWFLYLDSSFIIEWTASVPQLIIFEMHDGSRDTLLKNRLVLRTNSVCFFISWRSVNKLGMISVLDIDLKTLVEQAMFRSVPVTWTNNCPCLSTFIPRLWFALVFGLVLVVGDGDDASWWSSNWHVRSLSSSDSSVKISHDSNACWFLELEDDAFFNVAIV